jgi:hypothetical protein
VAVRLALQMGLHRESTYLNRPDAKCLRRIFWQLHVCGSPMAGTNTSSRNSLTYDTRTATFSKSPVGTARHC